MKISDNLKNKLRELINAEHEMAKLKCVLKVAHKLSDSEISEIATKFSENINNIQVEIDTKLIAGFIFAKGSTQHDYSLRSKILEQF